MGLATSPSNRLHIKCENPIVAPCANGNLAFLGCDGEGVQWGAVALLGVGRYSGINDCSYLTCDLGLLFVYLRLVLGRPLFPSWELENSSRTALEMSRRLAISSAGTFPLSHNWETVIRLIPSDSAVIPELR